MFNLRVVEQDCQPYRDYLAFGENLMWGMTEVRLEHNIGSNKAALKDSSVHAVDPSLPEWFFQLREHTTCHFSREGLKSPIEVQIKSILRRPFSTITFLGVQAGGSTFEVVAKRIEHHPINLSVTRQTNQSVIEFNVLSDLYPLFRQTDYCRVPRPVFVMPELELFVMESVPGTLLSNQFEYARYLASKEGFKKLLWYCGLSGRWLRCLHKFTGAARAGKPALNAMLDRCDTRLTLIGQKKDPRLPAGFQQEVRSLIRGLMSQLTDDDIITTGRHGDFGHWNMLVDFDRLTVIDFMGYDREPPLYDFLRMLFSIRSWKFHPMYDPRRVEQMSASFQSGYGSPPQLSPDLVRLCEVYHHVCTIHACLENPGPRWYHRIKTSRSLRASLADLADIRAGRASPYFSKFSYGVQRD